MKRSLALVLAVILFFFCFIAFACGAAYAVYLPGDDPNHLVIPTLSMLGGWFSGLGTFVAAGVALYIAWRQSLETRSHDAIRCIHHAMAIVHDLRSRVRYFEKSVREGGQFLAVLTRNAEAITKRYESLYDRDLYRHIPGPVVDSITDMSGQFFALDAWVAAQASALEGKLHAVLAKSQHVDEAKIDEIRKLSTELDDLFTALEVVAMRIDR